MNYNFQICFSTEFPDLAAFEIWIEELLAQYPLLGNHDVESISKVIAQDCAVIQTAEAHSDVEIGLLKTTCFEVVKKLESQESNKRQFEYAVKLLFENTPDARSYCASIARQLYQFRLSKTYEPREIIAEAYTRGIKRISAGNTIDNPLAWLRSTCLNVIRDFRREQARSEKPRIDSEPWSPGDLVYSEHILREDLFTICTAFENLSLEDQELLYKRAIDCLSWQEIAEMMTDEDGSPMKSGTARQRGARAVRKLRKIYEDIREDVIMPEDPEDPISV